MFNRPDWKARALAAEAALANANAYMAIVEQQLGEVQTIVTNRAALASIDVVGRTIRFIFIRNGETTTIETYATMDADVDEWRQKLLQP